MGLGRDPSRGVRACLRSQGPAPRLRGGARAPDGLQKCGAHWALQPPQGVSRGGLKGMAEETGFDL